MIKRMKELQNQRIQRERDEQFRKRSFNCYTEPSRNQPRYMAQDPFKPFDNVDFINLDYESHRFFI